MSEAVRELRLVLPDAEATERLGKALGERLRPGQVLALCGELGAGKTCLVRGLAAGLGVEDADAVASPTYLLVLEHPGRIPLRHADAYLPAKLEGFLAEGGADYLFDPASVVAIEWADRIAHLVPQDALWVRLAPDASGGRVAVLTPGLPGSCPWLADLPRILSADGKSRAQ